MRIGELARRSGVSVRALRHYEAEGLLVPGRSGNGYRDYGEDAEELVRQIRELIESGLPTRLIREVLPTADSALCPPMVEQVAGYRDQLNRRIECLTRTRDALNTYLAAVHA
ncbi:MerR family transcriptional regulator [Amycolatopsis granulosa]|uniref:MerR family transcriptional regulator n=1 Tax=Amycolatopsis granulosa TaxID=185684 RepID=UPI00142255F3|nr:MerR family transcriptional regulator [Amycolatopsis granulosa]NIH86635.1 DNA-binding transcriptional MerR regulator [Amycolatopsis granulosa]